MGENDNTAQAVNHDSTVATALRQPGSGQMPTDRCGRLAAVPCHHVSKGVGGRRALKLKPSFARFRKLPRRRARLLVAVALGVAATLAVTLAGRSREGSGSLLFEASLERLPADGFSRSILRVRSQSGEELKASFKVLEGSRSVRLAGSSVYARILPGTALLEARATGYRPARLRIETVPFFGDHAGDGTPDFLRLDSFEDRDAFRRWFCFIAEAQYFREPAGLQAEVDDCAALARFAYREALRRHDGEWAGRLDVPFLPSASDVGKYHLPHTPLGPRVFRILPGPFEPGDLNGPAYAEFADAQTLMRLNSHFITRDVQRAVPGDMLLFRQLEQNLPFHLMIYLGKSQLEPDSSNRVVYHTGPIGEEKGEIRRPALDELNRHPSPRWRPVPGNSNFLGVHRWNILRGAH